MNFSIKKIGIFIYLICSSFISNAQDFGRADSLRGYLFPERNCFDVTYYHLSLKVDPQEKFIQGFTQIHFDALTDFDVIQIDLFENLKINRIEFEHQELYYTREYNAVFISFNRKFLKEKIQVLRFIMKEIPE